MGLFERFPYTNFHELNAGWMLQMMKDLEAAWEQFTAGNSLSFADPLTYTATKSYAKNTIVLDESGNAYLSLDEVPKGVAPGNQDYWLMVFDYEAFMEKVNKNFTGNYYRDNNRATTPMAVGDWLTFEDVLCKATAAIAVDDLLEVGVNIEHFTLEQFLKEFVTSVNNILAAYNLTIQQYKNDIDASELQFKNEMQAAFDAAVGAVTVDSEVVLARIGANGTNYPTLADALHSQFMASYFEYPHSNFFNGNFVAASGGNISSNTYMIEGDFIPIENFEFASCTSILRMSFYVYDANYGTLGYLQISGQLNFTSMTKEQLLAEVPTAKYIRIKALKSDSTDVIASDLDTYNLHIYLNIPQDYNKYNLVFGYNHENYSATTKTIIPNKNVLLSDIIPLSVFELATIMTPAYLQIVCYDANFEPLGYLGNTSYKYITRHSIETLSPTTKYIRVKIGNSGVQVNESDLPSYLTEIMLNIPAQHYNRYSSEQTLMEKISLNADANGKYTSSFYIQFATDAEAYPKVVKLESMYTGTTPTMRYALKDPDGNVLYISPEFDLGSDIEPIEQFYRIVPKIRQYNKVQMYFTIPAGTELTINSAEIIPDIEKNSDITWVAHAGFIGMCPANVIVSFMMAAKLDFRVMVTIPKFTLDDVAVCFHDDDTIRNTLRYTDGSIIPNESADDFPIEHFNYSYLVNTFSAGYKTNAIYTDCKVPTLDSFFRICSLYGISPMLSLHPASLFVGSVGTQHFTAIKEMCDKYGMHGKLRLKSSDAAVLQKIAEVFEPDELDTIILIRPSNGTWDPLTFAKSCGLLDPSATSATESPYHLQFEMFEFVADQPTITQALTDGFKCSLAVMSPNNIEGADYNRYISWGITEFCADDIAQNGLYW